MSRGLAIFVLLAGCGVRRDIHDAALDAIAEAQDRVADGASALQACHTSAQELSASLQQCRDEVLALQRARDEVLADNSALRERLRAAGQDVDALLSQESALRTALQEANRALAEARKRQAEAEARDAMFRRVRDRLKAMIDSGRLQVRVVRGRLVLDLKQDVLFPSGSAELSPLGSETLAEIAGALSEFPDRAFQVEGHTDNVPIHTAKFPSNWDLSTARAVAVVNVLQARGMSPGRLSAAGFGEHQPRADNGSPEGRALNRRIEIVMIPDLQALPDLVDAL
jgi:chemotaxis protein MotB